MNRGKIANGVYFSSLDGNFRKSRLMITLRTPISRDNLTETALLPYLLERGTKTYPDMTKLKRRLDSLYGSELYTSASSYGYSRILSASIAGVDAKLVGVSGLSLRRAELLYDILFNPSVSEKGFDEKNTAIEKEKLRETIRSEINDKRVYALRYANRLFFDGDLRALPPNGYEDDIDKINGESLYKAYKKFVKSASIEILYCGSEQDKVRELMTKLFDSEKNGTHKMIAPSKAVGYADSVDKRLVMDVEQDKFVMMMTPGRELDEKELRSLQLACAMYGGAPMSRLFRNVREKQSLCYYCAARVSTESGAVTVDSGVDHSNAEKLKNAVIYELEQLQKGEFDDEEIEQARIYIINTLDGVADTAEGTTSWYLNSILRLGKIITPSEVADTYRSVKREDIISAFNLLKPSVRLLLTGEED